MAESPRHRPGNRGGRYAYAERVVDHDPATAMKWAQSISETSYRNECLSYVWRKWRQRDAAAAEEFLKRCGWPAELVANVKAGFN